jgi:CRISPR-associated protein Cmr3
MPFISIKATDTLFFRDGRPFSMGDETFAQGIFPPPPSVLYGALRSAAIANGLQEGKNLDQLISETESLSINFFGFQIGNDTYLPMPLDLIAPKPIKDKVGSLTANALVLDKKPLYSSAISYNILKSDIQQKTEDEPKLIYDYTFAEEYLKGNAKELHVLKRSDYILSETKIGIGRERDTNIAQDGKLFRVQMNRLAKETKNGIKELKFFLEFEGAELPEKGWLALGGERRTAFYQAEKEYIPSISPPELDSKRFKIYLSTPAVFKGGWQPENLLERYELKVLAAAIDRPTQIGGWDMQKRKPKPMLNCVPAGSVYYLEAADIEEAKNAALNIHGKSISDNINDNNYQKQGFGISYVGKI